ncbi:PASTA domain-containing protein [Desulfofustis glycolicus]|uniref:PASTA domain-containing protein n=1 Tax=Desulfofustis glycolicus DSM 9705 TaxID=1121409 RepID=A0A1M5YHH6_9BACT|nr:PASTA domain-containing protein [Desulfofustis glycolicus]MCB2217780.1 PASTA domain-containing protein [Desulfobulbaceae bacterium]SHI11374.1 PASTA domain-containing protein [Desulfofustis glycolicus DSM 9705]
MKSDKKILIDTYVFLLTLFLFFSFVPGSVCAQDSNPPEAVFDRWKSILDGVGVEASISQDGQDTGIGANASGTNTGQSQFLEFLKTTEQSTPYAMDPVGVTVDAIKNRSSIKIQGLTFFEENSRRVKAFAGSPEKSAGAMEVLATLQTLQHLIDCKNSGTSPRACAKTYILNKASARAMFEVLKLTGTATYGVVFSLVYADYVAIKNIMKAYEVTAGMWDDYEKAIKQQADNDISDVSNWDGRLSKLDEIITLFETQYITAQEQIADRLLHSWAESDNLIRTVKTEVKPALNAALENYRSGDFAAKAEELCPMAAWVSQASANNETCAELISRAGQQTGTISLHETYDSQALVSQYRDVCHQEMSDCRKALDQLREEANNPQDLSALLLQFDKADQTLLSAERSLREYEKNARNIQGRLQNLTTFLFSRIDEVVWDPPSDRIRAMTKIKGMANRITAYKPSRLPFDSMQGYSESLRDLRSDMNFLMEIPEKIIAERDRQLAKLEAYKKTSLDVASGCTSAGKLEQCIAECDDFEHTYAAQQGRKDYPAALASLAQLKQHGCPFSDDKEVEVTVPDVRGMTVTEAGARLAQHTLRMIVDYQGTTPDQDESTFIRNQRPGVGASEPAEGVVTVDLYRYDPDAAPTPCVTLKKRYQNAMATTSPAPELGKSILASADLARCYWRESARKHFDESISKLEAFQKEEAARKEKFCGELHRKYKEKMATKGNPVDFDQGRAILNQAEQCDWHDRARSHYAQSEAKRLQVQCDELASNFETAAVEANKTLDPSGLQAILSSARQCEWHDRTAAMMPCVEGEYKGLRAFNSGNMETAAHWAWWGQSKQCAYAARLSSLIDNRKAELEAQKYCQQLAQKFDDSIDQANNSLDASPLRAVLDAAKGCSWATEVSARMPCIEGEYDALRAYNSGDLQNAAAWATWGRNNNCTYSDRVEGLIQQRVAMLQQQPTQPAPGFWDTFGQSLAQGLEQYNRHMDAQTQQQMQNYMTQYFQQQAQKKRGSSIAPRVAPVQHHHQQPPPTAGPTCAQMNAQMLAACRSGGASPAHLESRYKQLGCQPSGELNQCIGQEVEKALQDFRDWASDPNLFKVR